MSLWADYLKERLGFDTIEVDGGFIAYHIKPPDASIEEFYVAPEKRGSPLAKRLADMVVAEARSRNCTTLWAKIVPGTTDAEKTLVMDLKYGFKLAGTAGNDIILRMNLGG